MKINTLNIAKDERVNFFITQDWHSFELDIDCYSILKQLGKLTPNSRLIINGDFVDAWYLMQKNPLYQRWINRKDCMDLFFIPNYEQEISWGNIVLDELCKVFSSIYFIMGNHEARFEEFTQNECTPTYKYTFNVARDLHLMERGIDYIGCNDYLDIANTSITHGMFHGRQAIKDHYLSCANNIIMGHLHRYEVMAFNARGKTKYGVSLPAMCHRPSPERQKWMKNKDNRHSTGFGQLVTDGPNNSFITGHVVNDSKLLLGTHSIFAQKESISDLKFNWA